VTPQAFDAEDAAVAERVGLSLAELRAAGRDVTDRAVEEGWIPAAVPDEAVERAARMVRGTRVSTRINLADPEGDR
jgi:hypothetical protein